MAFMGIFYAGAGAGQAAVMVGDASKAKAGRMAWRMARRMAWRMAWHGAGYHLVFVLKTGG